VLARKINLLTSKNYLLIVNGDVMGELGRLETITKKKMAGIILRSRATWK
jgi:hypothetical protein